MIIRLSSLGINYCLSMNSVAAISLYKKRIFQNEAYGLNHFEISSIYETSV